MESKIKNCLEIKNWKLKILFKSLLLVILIFGFLSSIYPAFAEEAFFLTPPGISEGETPGFLDYLGWLLKVLLGSVGILATLMIIVGGLQYVVAGASGNPEKVSDARNRILMAIGGLILALGSWLILSVINPDLLKLELTLPSVRTGIEGETEDEYRGPWSCLTKEGYFLDSGYQGMNKAECNQTCQSRTMSNGNPNTDGFCE